MEKTGDALNQKRNYFPGGSKTVSKSVSKNIKRGFDDPLRYDTVTKKRLTGDSVNCQALTNTDLRDVLVPTRRILQQ